MVTKAIDLLPGNGTALEEAIIELLDTRGRLSGNLSRVRRITWDEIPDDWLPWVVLDEGLEELVPFLDLRRVISEGRQWARERGSSAAIIRALGWLDFSVTLHYEPDADENFDLFQVELANPVGIGRLPDLIRLATLSKPTTDILARIFSGYDARPFRLDHCRLDGPDMLDDWSGVRLPETDHAVISFGISRIGEAAFEPTVTGQAFMLALCGATAIREGFVFDDSRLDNEVAEPAVLAIETIETSVTLTETDLSKAPWPQVPPWPGFAWTDFNLTVDGGVIASNPAE